MPELKKVLAEEDLKSSRVPSAPDLTPYTRILDEVLQEGGAGAEIALLPGESRRREKRRFSFAARQHDLQLGWRSAPEGMLRFVIAPIGEPLPGKRSRKARVEEVVKAPTRGRKVSAAG